MPVNFNCGSCQCPLSVLGQSDCSRAICPKCGNGVSVPTRSSSTVSPGQDSVQQLSTFFVLYAAHLDEVRFPTFDQRSQLLKNIDAEFRSRFPNVLKKKPSAMVDKSSSHVNLNYETIYISWRLFDQMKAFLSSLFRPYESDSSGPYREIHLR